MSSSHQNDVSIPQMNPSSQKMSSSWCPGNVSSYQMNIPSRLMNPTSYQISTDRQSMNSSGTPVNSSSQQMNLSPFQINSVPQQKNSSETPRETSSQQLLFLNQNNPATQQMSSSWAPTNPFSSQTNTSSGQVNLASNKIDTSSFHLNKKINSADNIKHIVDPAHPKHYSQFQYNKPKQVLNPKPTNQTNQTRLTPNILNQNIETIKTRKNTESSKHEQLQMPKAEQSQTLDDKANSMRMNVVSQNALKSESFSPERSKKLESKSSSQSPTKKIASAFSRLGHDFIHGLQNRNQESKDAFVPGKHKKSNFSKKD